VPVQWCTLPYSRAILLLPLGAVQAVQILTVCTRVHFTFTLCWFVLKVQKFISFLITVFLKRFIAQKIYRACTRASYRIVPLTNFNKYLHHDTSKTEVNMNMNVNKGCE
jgi:hypothetical protein